MHFVTNYAPFRRYAWIAGSVGDLRHRLHSLDHKVSLVPLSLFQVVSLVSR